jgi:hypothetical protein
VVSTFLRRCVILLFALSSPIFAAFRPSFRLDHSAWKASHIVLAVTTSDESTFEVVESWKGNLQPGDRLFIPELRPPNNAEPIPGPTKTSEPRLCDPGSTLIPREPPGSRLILFLVGGTDRSPEVRRSKAEIGEWKPSDIMDSMQASVVWVNRDGMYAFEQVVNPGIPFLCRLPLTETQARNRVAEIEGVQERLAMALALPRSEERAERLQPFVGSDVLEARLSALSELGNTGPSAVPVISRMLDEFTFADVDPELIHALAEAGGAGAGKEMNRRLQEELRFWKAKGPTLKPGWIDSDVSPHAPLRQRFNMTNELILGLQKTRYPAALMTVIELRDVGALYPS